MGLTLLNKINEPIVTFFGSHKVTPENEFYQQARHTAFELGKRGYAILSGGGPGIMHAANSGAMEAGTPSIGLRAELLEEQEVIDKIFTHKLSFHFLFTRRFVMAIKSEALVFYPGGYGTLNELFDYAVLCKQILLIPFRLSVLIKNIGKDCLIGLKKVRSRKIFLLITLGL